MSLNPTNVQVKKSRLHRLDAYLVAGVGVAGMASTANAAVVSIDMTPYSAVNGGLLPEGRRISATSQAPEVAELSYLMDMQEEES